MNQAILDFCEHVDEQSDILQTVLHYTTLKRGGKLYYGRCPFHDDKNQSLSVSPDKGLFYCFGCGAGGNAIKFISLAEGITYFDAIKLQAKRLGIPLPKEIVL